MKKILLLGAGKSTPFLIKYLAQNAQQYHWNITVADMQFSSDQQTIFSFPAVQTIQTDFNDALTLENLIREAHIVISMLPPFLHIDIIKLALKHNIPVATASYATPEISSLHEEAVSKGIPVLMEMGLDPGIDHMSAMKEIDDIRNSGGTLTGFKSYTGGLVAPDSDNNPWNYKITWNPRNVILAGQGTVKYLYESKHKYIPYHQLFTRTYNTSINNYGSFEGYANRDSLKYLELYGLKEIPSFIRGTLRRPGFCEGWNILVQLGVTDDSFTIENSDKLTRADFFSSFLPENVNTYQKLFDFFNINDTSHTASKLKFLDFFSDTRIKISSGSPARILQEIMEDKWKLQQGDKDMVVMQHEFTYKIKDKTRVRLSSLVDIGENSIYTSMARTVGIPLGIGVKLILTGQLTGNGVIIPVKQQLYTAVLHELAEWGIKFETEEKIVEGNS